MNILRELKEMNASEDLMTARLACAYTLLAMAPYDNWGHEGTPAEMAAYVIGIAKKNGNLSFVADVVGMKDYWRTNVTST